jgi:TonB family C-terminal domain
MQTGIKQQADTTIFELVEMMPQYPGGTNGLLQYIGENTVYPEKAKNEGIQGRVILRFVVEEDGSISNISIVRGIDPELDAEAVRLVRSMPKWNPGKQKGKAVRVKYTLPVAFSLRRN